jgi:hypothetical protein
MLFSVRVLFGLVAGSASTVPPEYVPSHIRPVGGVGEKYLLSCTEDGTKVDLYSFDDGSNRQKWEISKGDGDWYHIQVHGGTSGGRTLLSTVSDGTKVDLWNHDDGSGRQRWKISDQGDYYHIEVYAGVGGYRRLLSTVEDGSKVDLYDHDDGSGRQRWIVEGDGCFVTSPDDVIGQWTVHATIPGAVTETWKHGTSKKHTESKSDEWSMSATRTVTRGFKFEEFSAESKIESSISRSISNSYSSEWGVNDEYDWTIQWSQSDIGKTAWQFQFAFTDTCNHEETTRAQEFAVTEGAFRPPCCLPGYATDAPAYLTCVSKDYMIPNGDDYGCKVGNGELAV